MLSPMSEQHRDRPGAPTEGHAAFLPGFENTQPRALRGTLASRTAAENAAFLLPHLRSGRDLVDCGCGPGTITLGLAELVAPGTVFGVDLDPNAIAQARAEAAGQGAENVRFTVGDVRRLPAADASFDAAFQNRCFEHLSDAAPAVREVFRVLRPGGVFGSGERLVNADVWGNLGPVLKRGMALAIRATNRASLRRAGAQGGVDRQFAERLSRLLIRTGFRDLEVSAYWEVYGDRERVAWMGEYMAQSTQRPVPVRRIVASGWATQADLDRISDAWRTWGHQPSSYCAIARVGFVVHKPG
jgi:SAM-dependent methyltransferase